MLAIGKTEGLGEAVTRDGGINVEGFLKSRLRSKINMKEQKMDTKEGASSGNKVDGTANSQSSTPQLDNDRWPAGQRAEEFLSHLGEASKGFNSVSTADKLIHSVDSLKHTSASHMQPLQVLQPQGKGSGSSLVVVRCNQYVGSPVPVPAGRQASTPVFACWMLHTPSVSWRCLSLRFSRCFVIQMPSSPSWKRKALAFIDVMLSTMGKMISNHGSTCFHLSSA